MRCCGNCFWSFSPEDEEELRREYHGEDYDMDESAPKAGNCSIGCIHNKDYYCPSHSYNEYSNWYQYYLSLNIDKYDKIFYLEPEFEIEDDKVRSINKEFRDEIVEIFHNYISNFKIPVIRPTGTIRERLNKIYEECFNVFEGADIGIFLEDKRAKMPKVAYKGTSACFDLICIEDTIIPARGSAIVPNGLHITVPNGYYLEFATRSGMGIKQNLRVHPGIIDSGYSGELSVKVFNLSDKEEIIKADKSCVQVKVVKIPEYRLRQITKEEFEEYQKNSIRGNNGFGSSDKSKN